MGLFLFGKDGVLYTSATVLDGTNATTVPWVEYDNVRDVTGDFASTVVDTTTRASAKKGWESEEAILKKGTVSFNMPQKKEADATFDKIRDAWLNETTVPFLSCNQAEDVVGAQGFAANMAVQMTEGMPLKDLQTWDVTLTASSGQEWFERA